MRRIFLIFLLLLSARIVSAQTTESAREAGQVMVQLKPQHQEQSLGALLEQFSSASLTVERQLSRRMNIWLLEFDETSTDAAALLRKLQQHPYVSLAQFNHLVQEREIIPDDPSFPNQWALKNTGQMGGSPGVDIKATEAWEITSSGLTAQGDTVVVAMIDGGIDLGHSDLKLWKNRLEIPYNSIDDDENGYIDDYNGWNAYSNNGNLQQSDHGTHVAGIATARGNNGIGVTGVAFNTYLMPIAGSGTNEAVAVTAYDYVFEMRKRYDESNGAAGAFVVVTNSSFGIDAGNPANYPLWGAIYDSLGSVGILNVASTANRAWDVDAVGDIPTAMTNESIVAVTNSTNTDELNSQAAWGHNSIDFAAPGSNIYSTRQGDTYGYKTGTSMSSPQASGAIALMYAAASESILAQYKADPVLISSKFKRYLIASVDSLPDFEGVTVSGGRLNLLNALQMVVNPPNLLADPSQISFAMEPNSTATAEVLLTSLNTEQNPYILSVPDTIHWVYAEVPGGLLLGSNPGTITLNFNTTGLEIGSHITTMRIIDSFLNELLFNIEIKVEEGVGTRFSSNTTYSLKAIPNPLNGNSYLTYSLGQAGEVNLQLLNLNGQLLTSLFSGNVNAGMHTLPLQNSLKAGIYLIRLTSRDKTEVIRVIQP